MRGHIAAISVIVMIVMLPSSRTHAQDRQAESQPQFDAVSIKPNRSGEAMIGMRSVGNRFLATNVPVRELIRLAWQLIDSQIVSTPSWTHEERFDVEAAAAGALPRTEPFGAPTATSRMLQAMLRDRFGLVVHVEQRELPVMTLVRRRDDGRLGASLRPVVTACTPTAGTAGAPDTSGCDVRMMPGTLQLKGRTMAQFARVLSGLVGRVVLDRTMLEGVFDLELRYQNPPRPAAAQGVPGAEPPADNTPREPSLFDAIEEQLGLELKSTTGLADVLVVDRVERPAPD
jgi:uncharacterized protein (TIGR03435 family)